MVDMVDMADTAGTAEVAEVAAAATRRGTERTPTWAVKEIRTSTVKTPREVGMLNTKVVTWSLALFATLTYLVCVVYGLIVPETLHMTGFLEQMLPGFRWLTPTGFVIGFVEAFLYGAYAGLVFTPIYNRLWRRWAAPE